MAITYSNKQEEWNVDLEQMRCFIAVAESKSITKAAKELYMSQPSLSRCIFAAEEDAGVKLLDRTSRPLTLTYAGKCYYETAKQILQMSTELTRQFHDIEDCHSGEITIGLPVERAAYMLPAVLSRFYEKYPGVRIRSVEDKVLHLEEHLWKGSVDLIVCPAFMKLADNEQIECVPLGREELILVSGEGAVSRDYCLDGFAHTVDFKLLKDFPFVLQKKGHAGRRMCDELFQKHQFEPNIVYEATSNALVLRLVEVGMGLGVVPQMTTALHTGMTRINTFSLSAPPMEWSIIAAYRKGTYQTKAQQHLLSLIQEFYAASSMPS